MESEGPEKRFSGCAPVYPTDSSSESDRHLNPLRGCPPHLPLQCDSTLEGDTVPGHLLDFHDSKTTWKLTADWGLGSSYSELVPHPVLKGGRGSRKLGEKRPRGLRSPRLMPQRPCWHLLVCTRCGGGGGGRVHTSSIWHRGESPPPPHTDPQLHLRAPDPGLGRPEPQVGAVS